MTQAAAQATWASAVLGSLVQAGVQHLVISPGSRSTPLVCAAQWSELVKWPLLDERSAAFFALGLAREKGDPVAMLCTSGSAGSHYHPALIEASAVGLPLVAITADRPPELQGCAAPQTTEQRRLFADHVRAQISLGPASPDTLAEDKQKLERALARLFAPWPGPVHINLPFRKPLEPPVAPPCSASAGPSSATLRLNKDKDKDKDKGTAENVNPSTIQAAAQAIILAKRALLVCGPGDLAQRRAFPQVAQFAERAGLVVFAEASSDLRFRNWRHTPSLPALDWLFGALDFERHPELAPDLIVELGRPPTSKCYAEWLAKKPAIDRYLVTPIREADPHHSAQGILFGPVERSLEALCQALPHRQSPAREFVAELTRCAAITTAEIERTLSPDRSPLSEGGAMRAAITGLPSGALVVVGNSLPIRTLDHYVLHNHCALDIATQRGVNGIDGLLSGAAGASAARSAPVVLLVGDISFAHDIGGLAAMAHRRGPVVIVVFDNGGGRIFEHLDLAKHPIAKEILDDFFIMSSPVDIELAARAYGLRYQSATTSSQLTRAVQAALASSAATVVHAAVDPHSSRTMYAKLAQRIPQALAER